MKRLILKVKSAAGESLAEVLVSLLIGALALLLLAGMITASSAMVKRSTESMETYNEKENAAAEKAGTGSGTVVLKYNGRSESFRVKYDSFEAFGNKEVISYEAAE